MKKLAVSLAGLPWLVKVLLAIFLDAFFGGIIRIGLGKKSFSRLVGWVILILGIATALSLALPVPEVVLKVCGILYSVCEIVDIITVLFTGKIKLFAD